jgi:DNA-3-methyladenine glycosylase II
LDYTVDVLRRVASNAVDVVGADGAYYRALSIGGKTYAVRVVQTGPLKLELSTDADPEAVMPVLRRILGLDVDLSDWNERAERVAWLAPFARAFRGMRPPRYPTLWEACAHAVVFQQISIHAASAIMRRMVERLGERVSADGIGLYAFPTPSALLSADEETLRAAGLSSAKRMHLRSAAMAIEMGEIDAETIESMPTPDAATMLARIRGIGPWSAAIILLRGFGRLDVFPMRDSGAARTIKQLSGTADVDIDAVLEVLGPARGMLYFHLLLGRLHDVSQI